MSRQILMPLKCYALATNEQREGKFISKCSLFKNIISINEIEPLNATAPFSGHTEQF